jgi:hypothetical protein
MDCEKIFPLDGEFQDSPKTMSCLTLIVIIRAFDRDPGQRKE